MALTDAQRVDLRRHCGYEVFGNSPDQFFGYRYFQHYGTLEYRASNLSTAEEAVVVDKYLTPLAGLETAILSTSDNLDTAKAAVWEHNPNEQRDRDRLFDAWRRRLCGFMGVPAGPALGERGIRLVV